MLATPQSEHHWLNQLLGDWVGEGDCSMGPDQPPATFACKESVRSLGGMWIVAESITPVSEQDHATNIITLGFDPERNRYVGSFISSMMAMMWLYEGSLDPTGKILTLDTTGPKQDGSGTAKYQDIITLISETERKLTSRILGEDGNWTEFMSFTYRRQS